MPSVPNGQLPKETLSGWSGINLRVDGLDVGDQEVLSAVNADLHTQLGVLRMRQGRTLLNGTNLGAAASGLFRHAGRRYQAAGVTLFRDFAIILTDLAGGITRPTVFPYQPLNDTTTWSFIADQNTMRKDNGTTVYLWGMVAPVAAPTLAVGAAGSLSGAYSAVYTYVRVVGTSVAHESNPSASPAPVTLTSDVLSVPVVASADAQVTHIRIYRTVAGGSSYFFDQQVANATATIASSQADDLLGTEVETDNDPPPKAACAAEFQGHIFLCNDPVHPDYLWYSKRFRPESFPPDQFLKIGDPSDPLLSMVSLTGVLGIFTYLTKYRMFGNSVSGFTALEALNSRGVASANATLSTSRGVAFVAKDGIWLTNFVEADQELSQGIQGLFYGQTINGYLPVDVNTVTNLLTLAEYKRRIYFGYRDIIGTFITAVYSVDTQHWYHYNHDSRVLLYEEDTDQLTVGGANGLVSILERGGDDAGVPMTMNVALPPRDGGDRFARKGYEWLGVESQGAAAWAFTFSVDGQVVTTATISGPRRTRYVRLPEQTAGRQWQVSALYTGTTDAALYTVEVLHTQHHQGQVWVEEFNTPNVFLQILPGTPAALPLQRRRFTFLTLDADTAPNAQWEADLYVDGLLVASLTIPGPRNKMLYALPAGLTGYEWYTRVRYSDPDMPLLYTLDVLDTGVPDGQTWIAAPAYGPNAYQRIMLSTEPVHPGALPLQRRRFTFLTFDADATAEGSWTVDLYVDGRLAASVTIPGARNKFLYALPAGLTGYEWNARARHSGADVPPVHTLDVLDTGVPDGQIWIAAPHNVLGAYQMILPATEPVNPFVRKRFLYLRLDAEAGPGFWTLDLYIDDVLRQSIPVHGNRNHGLVRLQSGLLGYTWHMIARYSVATIPAPFRVQMLTQELQVA